MNMPRKVLFTISTLDTGGAQRAMSNLIMTLPHNYLIDILLNDDSSIVYPYRGRIITLGLESKGNKRSLIYQLRVLIKRLIILRRLKKNNDYSACVSFLDSANVANIITGRGKGCRIICSVRAHMTQMVDESNYYRYIVKPLLNLYKNADSIIAVSKSIKDDLIENFNLPEEKIRAIYNGVDIDYVRKRACTQTSYDVPFPKGAFCFVTSGRLEKQKAQLQLIEAFARVHSEYKDTCLVIIGDGSLRTQLAEKISKLELDDCIFLTGYLSNPFPLLSRADVFVIPSQYEGFANVIIEAMALGLPIISTDHESGAREILAPDTDYKSLVHDKIDEALYGILVPTGTTHNNEYLAETMIELYCNEEKRKWYSSRSIERSKQLSVKRMADEWMNVIEND